MSEFDAVDSSNAPNTVESMARDLTRLGIENQNVLVHVSMSSIGWVCGGSEAVILALLSVVGEAGTIVMPAHSGGNSEPKYWQCPPVPSDWFETIYNTMPPFDPATAPTRGMGVVAEHFRTFPNARRSYHPQVSFAAIGKNAERITSNHSLTPQLGFDTPLGELYRLGGKVLLLGVGYDKCTAFHVGETLWEDMPRTDNAGAITENGRRVWKRFEDFDYDNSDFRHLGEAFEKEYPVVTGNVGNAECRLFDVKDAIDFAAVWIKKERGKRRSNGIIFLNKC